MTRFKCSILAIYNNETLANSIHYFPKACSKFCPKLNKPSKNCQSGEISPNLVTLVPLLASTPPSAIDNFDSNISKVFRKALVWFSIGGEHYITDPIEYEYMPDKILEEPRNVSIRLEQKVGRFVKIQLFFMNNW